MRATFLVLGLLVLGQHVSAQDDDAYGDEGEMGDYGGEEGGGDPYGGGGYGGGDPYGGGGYGGGGGGGPSLDDQVEGVLSLDAKTFAKVDRHPSQ
jgi:hypothetical protein